ncbi:hypothetical protein [Actinophytocola sp. KF-1]
MTPLTALYRALPISSGRVRVGNQTGCGGIADARLHLEAARAYEFVDATPAARHDDQELVAYCVTNVRAGVEAELTALFGRLPAVRVTLDRVLPHAVDSNEWINQLAGRSAVQDALRAAGLGGLLPSPEARYRVVTPPRPS